MPEYLMLLSIALLSIFGIISHKRGSEQRRMVDALNESDQRYQAIFENAAIGIAKVSTDGQFLEINKEFCRIIGYTREDVLSQKLGFQHITFPDDMETCWDLAKQLLAESGNNFTLVSAQLGINPTTLWRWRKLGKI